MTFLFCSLLSANKALLLSNLGRLMRLCAQAVGRVHSKGTGKRGEFSQEERSYFNKVTEPFSRIEKCQNCHRVLDLLTPQRFCKTSY